jgi:acetate kinase
MGMTPLEGLVMGSRCGDIDPGIVIQLMRDQTQSADELDTLLNRHSGLLGMTGTNNMQDIEQRAARGDDACRRAIDLFTHRARKYIGAYAAVMGGVDAIVFTGGIGEHSALIRHRIAQRFDYLGASLNEERNRDATPGGTDRVIDVSAATSRVKLLVIATDEELAIAEMVEKVVEPI